MSHPPEIFDIRPSAGPPIYRQLIDQARALIAGGRLKPGDYLPGVRRVAKYADVNPMTVSKAYAQLESDGVVERVPGQGMQVCAPRTTESLAQRRAQFRAAAQPAFHHAHQLGLSPDDIRRVLDDLLKEYQP